MKRYFYEELNTKCENIYNKVCNLTDEDKGKYKNRNSYIFNYIYDKYGFRIGVIVCFMDKEKNLPKIGWSLMRELTVGEPNIIIEKLYDIPTFRALVDNNSVNSKMYKLYTFIRDVKKYKIDGFSDTISGISNIIILNRKQRDMLIDIAIARAVTYTPELSKNYYCNNSVKGLIKFKPCAENDDYITDIRNNRLVITGNAFIQNKVKESICKNIRDAVRAMEYRAWKYYKYEEESPIG